MTEPKNIVDAPCQECVDRAAEALGINPVPASEVGWWCSTFDCGAEDGCRCWETLATAVVA